MRVAVIINPIAGGRRRATEHDRPAFARAWFDARGIRADIALTTHHGHAVELARGFVGEGIDRVIAWGGDGTANQVAGPLIGTRVVMGLVPSGSGDGLAGGLGLPGDAEAALAIALGDSIVPLDVGWLGDRHFLNVGGMGFDGAVADAFQRRAGRGLVGYWLAGVGCLWRYRSATYTLNLEGDVSREERFLVAFLNGREYGNGFVLVPDGSPCDGLLDVVIVTKGSILRQLWRGRRFLLTRKMDNTTVIRRQIRIATVSLSGTGQSAHVDGEPFEMPSQTTVRVEAGALRLAAVKRPAVAG